MKVRIVSVPDSSNFGSFLQAYALSEIVRSFSNDVFFEKTRDDKYIKNLFINKKAALRIVLKDPIFGISKVLYLKKQYKVFREEWDKHFIIKKGNADFDLTLLGSDEIWNIRNSVFCNPVFFGGDCENAFAFAVSVGSASEHDFSKNNYISKLIKRIKLIFPRDENTKNIVDNILATNSERVCDPTFLYDFNNISPSELTLKKLFSLKHKYFLVYAYQLDKKVIKLIKEIAIKKQLCIVSIGFYHKFADLNLNCSPLDMFWIFKNACLVFTTTFHGTVFSIITNKQFVSNPKDSIAKVGSLLRDFSLESQLIDNTVDYETFEQMILKQIDYSEINKKIDTIRSTSMRSLKEILTNGIKM